VAAHANVSIATVSHVLNGTRLVSTATKEKVLQAVEELRYFRNESARQLRVGTSELLGVLIVDYNPFFMDILHGVEKMATKQGWKLLVASTGEDWEAQKELLNALISRRVEGILLAPVVGATKHELQRYAKGDIPLVFIDRIVEGCGIPAVTSTNVYGAQLAVEHLIDHGYRKIGVILGSLSISSMVERKKGYERALNNARIDIQSECMKVCNALSSGGYQAINQLLADVSDLEAVFVTNNLMLLGVLKAIQERSLRIPEDIAVVAVDFQPWVELIKPSITLVSQPAEKIGEMAVNLLMVQRNREPVAEMMMKTELIIGESCGCRKSPVL